MCVMCVVAESLLQIFFGYSHIHSIMWKSEEIPDKWLQLHNVNAEVTLLAVNLTISRMMSDSISSPKYPSWASAARSIWREGGIKAVYRGFVPCILRAFPTVSRTAGIITVMRSGLTSFMLSVQNGGALFVWETSMRLMNAEKVR